MRIVHEYTTAWLHEPTSDELAWLRATLLFDVSESTGNGFSATQLQLVNEDDTFPRGLVPVIRAKAKKDGFSVTVEDQRFKPLTPLDWGALDQFGAHIDKPIDDRPFQLRCIKSAARATCGIIKVGTGGGKTAIMSGLAAIVGDATVVVFTDQAALASQLRDEIAAFISEKVGLVAKLGAKPTRDLRRVTVFTYSMARSFLRKGDEGVAACLRNAQMMCIDEVHQAGAPERYATLQACQYARWRIGFSATPLKRSDRKSVLAVAVTGPQIEEVGQDELLACNAIVGSDIKMYEFDHERMFNDRRTPLQKRKAELVKNMRRNELVMKLVDLAPKPCFVVYTSLSHGRLLALYAKRHGFLVALANGKDTPPDQRKEILRKAAAGQCDVIVTNDVLGTGYNCNELAGMVLADIGASHIRLVQTIGRGTRLADTKELFKVLDIYDVGYFESQSKTRFSTYVEAGHLPEIVRL